MVLGFKGRNFGFRMCCFNYQEIFFVEFKDRGIFRRELKGGIYGGCLLLKSKFCM